MKIFLFYSDKIYNFILPKEIEGSYGFDADKNASTKLINVEARNGEWVIFSVEGIDLYSGNMSVKDAILNDDSFFIVGKNGQRFLVYAQSISSDKFTLFSYNQLNIIIGNTNNANIKYPCPYLNQNEIKISKSEDNIILSQSQIGIAYVNNYLIKENKYFIKTGDYLNIFGLKLIFLNGVILVNNPGGKIIINPTSGIFSYNLPADEVTKNILFQDKELYDKDDYFSKAPRIRRIIERKTIKLSPPPTTQTGPELPLILTIGPMISMGMISFINIVNVMTRLASGETTFGRSWPQIFTAFAMLSSMVLWPIISRKYSKMMQKKT